MILNIYCHDVQHHSVYKYDEMYLDNNFQYIIPMGLNQFGSIVYVIALQNIDLTISVPVANSLTFVFTAISGWILGERLPKKSNFLNQLC